MQRNKQEKYFNKSLCSARVVTESSYGMLKGRWRLTYKKCECKLYNVRYAIMTAAVLHNIWIYRNDPWNTVGDWKLKILDSEDLRRNVGKNKIVRTKALMSHEKLAAGFESFNADNDKNWTKFSDLLF